MTHSIFGLFLISLIASSAHAEIMQDFEIFPDNEYKILGSQVENSAGCSLGNVIVRRQDGTIFCGKVTDLNFQEEGAIFSQDEDASHQAGNRNAYNITQDIFCYAKPYVYYFDSERKNMIRDFIVVNRILSLDLDINILESHFRHHPHYHNQQNGDQVLGMIQQVHIGHSIRSFISGVDRILEEDVGRGVLRRRRRGIHANSIRADFSQANIEEASDFLINFLDDIANNDQRLTDFDPLCEHLSFNIALVVYKPL